MPYIVQQATECRFVDTATKLMPPVIAQVAANGYAGVVRYVPLPGNKLDPDIDSKELGSILDAGLALLLVQHVRNPKWNPARHPGEIDAAAAIKVANAAGYLPGAHVFLDLEGISGNAADTKAFAEAWAAAIVQAGYRAGCYVGYDVPLDAVQLYDLRNIRSYWSDAGTRVVARRGFAMKQQQPSIIIAGVEFDIDTMQPDNLGDTPFWMIAQPPQPVA
jgi:hypothetical protein